jgi:uncharacterized membrane protein YdbT with pleckstrin-like domain
MKVLTIKRLEVTSVAKFVGTVNAVIAVFVGLIGSFSAIISVVTANDHSGFEAFGISLAILIGGIVLYPILMFLLGWLYGALMALIFNLFSNFSGGIKVDVEETK